jgi:prepilin-type N-terminal cleavage/methylation domain-containing protein
MLIKQQSKTIWGFSLIELLVVISIIGVLSAVLVANFMGMRERARDAQRIQDLYAIKNALRMYYNDIQSYPGESGCRSSSNCLGSYLVPAYMTSLSGIGYTYDVKNGTDGFLLQVGLEAGAGDEDINSQAKCNTGTSTNKIFAVCAN